MYDSAAQTTYSESPGHGNVEWVAILVDQNGLIKNCSPYLPRLLGDAARNLIGKPLRNVLPRIPIRQHTPGYNRAFTSFWQNRRGLRQKIVARGNPMFSDVETTLCHIPAGGDSEPPMILVGLRFPNDMLKGCEDLEQLKKKTQNNSGSIMVTDQNGLIAYVNPAFEQLSGYRHQDAVGKPASLLKSGLHEESFYSRLWETLNHGREFRAVFANRRRNGEIFFEEKCIRPFVDKNNEQIYFVALSHPIDDFLQETFLRLERLANHDPLTGLPNRNLFLDRLYQHFSRATRNGTRFALAYIDLDGFKEINDTFGHPAGDLVLQATARHIKNALRDEDTVGRLGGDEFGLILSDTRDEKDVVCIIEKILATLSKGVVFEDQQLKIDASIGVICYPEGGENPDCMLRHADSLMYSCKLSGGKGFRLFHTAESSLSAKNGTASLPVQADELPETRQIEATPQEGSGRNQSGTN